jgi:hypothetical protein
MVARMDVPSFVLARPGAASSLAETRLVGVGFMHHPELVDMPQLAEPRSCTRCASSRTSLAAGARIGVKTAAVASWFVLRDTLRRNRGPW